MDPGMADKLKERCRAEGVSVTSVISKLVAGYLGDEAPAPKERPQKKSPGNRGRRRRELRECIAAVERICRGEEDYLDNIPENLRGSIRYERAENSVEHLLAAIDELVEVYPDDGG